jgi:hypothetical protein
VFRASLCLEFQADTGLRGKNYYDSVRREMSVIERNLTCKRVSSLEAVVKSTVEVLKHVIIV